MFSIIFFIITHKLIKKKYNKKLLFFNRLNSVFSSRTKRTVSYTHLDVYKRQTYIRAVMHMLPNILLLTVPRT